MRRLLLLVTCVGIALSAGSLLSVRSQVGVAVGFAVLDVDEGSLQAAALFSSRNPEGVLVWEAGVAAVEPRSEGRLFVDESGDSRTALALANASDQTLHLSLTIRDEAGDEIDTVEEILDPWQHRALFVRPLFPNLPTDFVGSLEFATASSEPFLGAVSLRRKRNLYGEDIFATLPVAAQQEPSAAAQVAAEAMVVLPHVGFGGGISTQLVLINTSPVPTRGTVRLVDSAGQPLKVEFQGALGSEFDYDIAGYGVFWGTLQTEDELRSGYALLEVEPGDPIPAASAVLRILSPDGIVSEAGIPAATPATAMRLFVDADQTRTGVALASPGSEAQTIRFHLLDRFGSKLSTTQRQIVAGGHMAVFADELFASLPEGFTGLMEIEAEAPVAAVSLKLTINRRGDAILTTLPVADLTRPSSATRLIFPQFGIGDGFASRLIFLNAQVHRPVKGQLSFFQTEIGEALELPLGDRFGSLFDFEMEAGEGLQYWPGDTARVAEIRVDTFRPDVDEIVVNKGSTLRIHPRVIDSEGKTRDDFTVSYSGVDAKIAQVDQEGLVSGIERGFSSLKLSAGDAESVGSITVVELRTSGTVGPSTGIVQDLAGRIYFAVRRDHVIYRADTIDAVPQLYAGSLGAAGLVNGERALVRLNQPGFLALNQATGDLFVSDTGNHVIRRIRADGLTETLAGSGQPGDRDGPVAQAGFRNPQGIALDDQGFLWVADSGNHTIRRIDLGTSRVETVAGHVGQAGHQDGLGRNALFAAPLGIAIERRDVLDPTHAEQPTQTQVVVADSGNGTVRRVFANGTVATLQAGRLNETSSRLRGQGTSSLPFQSPFGVAVDARGRILVTDQLSGEISVIGGDGTVLPLYQREPGIDPFSVSVIGEKIVFSSNSSFAIRAVFGEPAIIQVTPQVLDERGGEVVTIRGRNFNRRQPVLLIGGQRIQNVDVIDPTTIRFETPELEVASVQNLSLVTVGGLSQKQIVVGLTPLEALRPGEITTLAGLDSNLIGDGGLSTAASFGNPTGLAMDPVGNLYISDSSNNRIRKVARDLGVVTTVVGDCTPIPVGGELKCELGDGGLALTASLAGPAGITFDGAGNLYVADTGHHRIRKVDAATGTIATVVGGCNPREFSCRRGDHGPATSASLDGPTDIALDAFGNIYITDTLRGRVRKVDATTGIIDTVAGREDGFDGDGGLAIESRLGNPTGILTGPLGNLYIADAFTNRIRKVDQVSGIITTVAGSGCDLESEKCRLGDGGAAIEATLNGPVSIAFDSLHNLYIAEYEAHRVRKVDAVTRIITTVAGNGSPGSGGDGQPAVEVSLTPFSLLADSVGNLFISDPIDGKVKMVDSAGSLTTVAGTPCRTSVECIGDGGLAISSPLAASDLQVNQRGSIYLLDQDHLIRRIDSQTGVIETVMQLNILDPNGHVDFRKAPSNLVIDANGNLYFDGGGLIRKLDSATGALTTIAGSRNGADGQLAGNAYLDSANKMTLDAPGNLYIADKWRVRRVDRQTGIITTVAGCGVNPLEIPFDVRDDLEALQRYGCDNRDGVPASTAFFDDEITNIAVDGLGNPFIIDDYNHQVRMVDQATSAITTVAGCLRTPESSCERPEDGVLALEAELDPRAIAVNQSGELFIVSGEDYRSAVWKVDSVDSRLTKVAGYSCDFREDICPVFDGPARETTLRGASDLDFDADGNLVISEFDDRSGFGRIRKVDLKTGFMTTLAGCVGEDCVDEDGSPAGSTRLYDVTDIAFDAAFNLYILDADGVRRMDRDTNTISLVFTTPEEAILQTIAVDSAGRLLLALDTDPNTNQTPINPEPKLIQQLDLQDDTTTEFISESGDNVPALAARLPNNSCIALDTSGNIYLSNRGKGLRRIDAATQLITALLKDVKVRCPLVTDQAGNIYFAQGFSPPPPLQLKIFEVVKKYDVASDTVTLVAGTGLTGDDVPATEARIDRVLDLAFDTEGHLYIAEGKCDEEITTACFIGGRIRRVDSQTGIITTVAGCLEGAECLTTDSRPALDTFIGVPRDLAVDLAGNLYFLAAGRLRAVAGPFR